MVIFAFEGEGSVPKSPVKIQAFVENCPYNARIFVIFQKISRHAWEKIPKMLFLTRVHVCVKAKLTLVIFLFFLHLPLTRLISWSISSSSQSQEVLTKFVHIYTGEACWLETIVAAAWHHLHHHHHQHNHHYHHHCFIAVIIAIISSWWWWCGRREGGYFEIRLPLKSRKEFQVQAIRDKGGGLPFEVKLLRNNFFSHNFSLAENSIWSSDPPVLSQYRRRGKKVDKTLEVGEGGSWTGERWTKNILIITSPSSRMDMKWWHRGWQGGRMELGEEIRLIPREIVGKLNLDLATENTARGKTDPQEIF